MQNKIFRAIFFVFLFAIFPSLARAGVLVTEIAWMGTAASANDEWIEIHNDGSSSVSLSGWTLMASDGTPSITLSGSIGAGEYKLLERTDDTTYPGITALLIFTGALGNDGESLTLKNGSTTVQTMNYSGGWPAGDATSKATMQWNGSSWVTASETAGSATSGGATGDDDDDTTGDDDDTTGDDDTGDDDTADDDDAEEQSELTLSLSKNFKTYSEMALKIEAPTKIVADTPTHFKIQALDLKRLPLYKGRFILNMGDGSIREYNINAKKDSVIEFDHVYAYPGSYSINVKYYKTYFEGNLPDVDETFSVEVSEEAVSISKIYSDGGVELKNSSGSSIDIANWRLSDTSGKTFQFPEDTIILSGKTVVFPKTRTKLNTSSQISLYTSTGTLAARYPEIKKSAAKTVAPQETPKPDGEVLGAETVRAEKERGGGSLVWILAFIILLLIAVIAALVLGKGEKAEESDYELIEE